MEENFDLLSKRIIDSLNKSDLEKINYTLKNINLPTLCTGVGGSSVVSTYMSKILNCKNNIIALSLEPRDLNYINLVNYKNVICASYSGKNYGVDLSFNNDLNKYLLSTNALEGIHNITYNSDDREHSFISLASTLIPMAILLNYYLNNDFNQIIEILKDNQISEIMANDVFEIMSGYETSTASKYLESTLVESAIAIPIVHDKYSYCHGRSTTSYSNNHSVIYFNGNTEFDKMIINELQKYYKELIKIDYKYKDNIINDFYLTYKSMLLSKKIAQLNNKDLSDVDYSPIVKKLYYFKGEI